jgi:Gti1/Pac2 family protein
VENASLSLPSPHRSLSKLVVHLTKYDFPKPWRRYSSPLKKAIPTGRAFPTSSLSSSFMQRPTHSRLHVRDARDAHTVFEAVRLGLLRPVTRRLNEVERSMYIASGAIFIWEESDDDLGLKRWTDGRVWSQSRMREVSRNVLVISQCH